MKAIEEYFHDVLIVLLYKVGPNFFQSVVCFCRRFDSGDSQMF